MRYQALDGWRGICALLVAVHHFHVNSHLYDVALVRNGYLFVDFFFVLSGFVISHAWGKRIRAATDFRSFMARRLARVWPLHVVVLGLFVAMEGAKAAVLAHTAITAENAPFTGDTSLPALFSNLVLVHSLGLHDRATWNYPSWSISTEFYTYAVFGLLCLVGFGQRTVALALVAALAALVVAAFSSEWLHTIADFGFFRCLYGFFIGCVVYRLMARRPPRLPFATVLEAAAVAVAVLVVWHSDKGTPLSMAAPVVFGLVVAVFSAEAGALSRLLRGALPQALGRWSYSVYLLHSLVLVLIGRAAGMAGSLTGTSLTQPIVVNGQVRPLLVFGGPWGGDLVVVAYVAVVAMAAALAWRWVEQPSQRLLHRLARD